MNSLDYLRQFKIGGFAIFDFTVSFLGMALLAPLLSHLFKKFGILVPKKNWVILTLPIGVLAHLLFGFNTPLTSDFLDLNGHYLSKVVVVGCCVLGSLGIRRVKPVK